jgi:hypothetical protein
MKAGSDLIGVALVRRGDSALLAVNQSGLAGAT